jgi:hypothetical protein
MYRTFLISGLVSISAKTFKFGDNDGFTPLHAKISSSVKHNFGSGFLASAPPEPTATTQSTVFVLNISNATDVTIPVHCAFSTGCFFFA